MSMRPIDFQTMVPKVSEMTRTQNELQQRAISQQQQQADQAAHGAQTQTKTVHQQDTAQKAGIREKRDERRRSAKGKRAQEQASDDETGGENRKKPDQPTEGRTIDIRV
jgi:hypothetical protein